jgi:predicted AAA+ superfamily ATPase
MHQDKCIIIDEIQLMPRLFPLLRALIDQNRVPARFLILGSASPTLIKHSSETLAGRIAYHELTPLTLMEVESEGISQEKHWFRGGFPDALLAPTNDLVAMWMNNFMKTFMHKHLQSTGHKMNIAILSRLYRMMAYVQGQLLNMSTLAASLGISQPTVNKYLDLLEGGFLIHRLLPYYVNVGKRLVKAPKIYFRDTGILHYLSNIFNFEALTGHPLIGASWEGYVIEQIRHVAGESWQFYFYRTQAGAETDLVLVSPTGKTFCIEIKYASKPALSKGFYQSVEDLNPDFQYLIVPIGNAYFINDKVKVCSLADFLKFELGRI